MENMNQNANQTPGFILVAIENMNQNEQILKGLPSSIDGLIKALGIEAEVILPEEVIKVSTDHVEQPAPTEAQQPELPEALAQMLSAHGEGIKPKSSITGSPIDKLSPKAVAGFAIFARLCQSIVLHEQGMSVAELKAHYDIHREHPIYDRTAYSEHLAETGQDTGYWNWVAARIEEAASLIQSMRTIFGMFNVTRH